MIKIVSALFAFYGLSSGNRLLQQAPATNPGGQIVNGQPEFVAAEPAPGQPIQATQATTATPIAAAPATTTGWLPVQLPPAAAQAMTLTCNQPHTAGLGLTCAGTKQEFTNAMNEFSMACSALGSCAQTEMVFNYDATWYGERIGTLSFSEAYSGYGASITVDNQSPITGLYIDRLQCKAAGACQDMTIKLIGASMNDVECDKTIGACNGCTIEVCKREYNNADVLEIVCGPKKACALL